MSHATIRIAGIFIAVFFTLQSVNFAYGLVDPNTLKRSIDEKSKELQAVNEQIQATHRNLVEIEEKGKTLKREIQAFDYRISQTNLGIKASQIKIERYRLEIESLENGIVEKTLKAREVRSGVAEMLRELQTKDRDSLFMAFLRNQSLADSLQETESVTRLSSELTDQVQELEAVKAELTGSLESVHDKKAAVEGEQQTLKSRRVASEEERGQRQTFLVTTKNQEKLYQEQLKELQQMQDAIAAEIEAIEHELRSRIDPNLLPIPRPGVLAWPTSSGIMSQGYGQTKFAALSYKGKWHNGIDIAAPIGAPIFAAESGEVVAVGNQDKFCPRGAYGKFIVVRHDNGFTTLYGHLSGQIVTQGAAVARGQTIGYMGRTGWATGSHLHFTLWSSTTHAMKASRSCGLMPVGGDLDPLQYLERAPS